GVLRRELEVDDALEVVAALEAPARLQPLDGEALSLPERFELVGVGRLLAVRLPQPGGEGAVAEIVVDDERRATGTNHALELGEPGLASRPEEVGEAGMGDV